MGKHSSPERTPFIRSVATWALPWLLIAAVIAVALIVVVDMVSNDPIRTSADDVESGATPAPDEEAKAEPPSGSRNDGQAGSDKAKASEKKKDPMRESAAPNEDLITKGVDVQVLNGTGDAEADDIMADRLARLGYSVVAVSPAAKAYPRTVVFWTGDSEDVGRLLADRFDWHLDGAPANLSPDVALHVVVGEDAL